VRSILPIDALGINETQVRFVDQRRGLEAMRGPFAAHAPLGDLVQFIMNQRDQTVERPRVATSPIDQQPGDILRCVGVVHAVTG
jgi:hypothetical protein